jgi:hypothetical protein
VKLQRVDTPEQAERMGFRGSPTILIDGRDPWASAELAVGLACRIYQTEAGPDGAPSVGQIAAEISAGSMRITEIPRDVQPTLAGRPQGF